MPSDCGGTYERGTKEKNFRNYRTIDSLQEYLLIAQDSYHIEHYVRQAGHEWVLTEADELDAVITLPSIQSTLVLSDAYEKVDFDER